MAENVNIYSALAKCQSECKLAGKSGKNTFDGYTYAMLEDYIEVIRKPMSENGLSLTVSVKTIERLPCRKTQSGKEEQVVQVCLQGTLSHESEEQIVAEVYGEGQDRSDKAIYKAITGGKKYLIADLFNIATSDDPEGSSDHERDNSPQIAGKAPVSQTPAKATMAPLTTGTGVPASIMSVKTVNQTLAGQAPGKTNDQRLGEGIISSIQYDETIALLRKHNIVTKKWRSWLKDVYGFESLANMTTEKYEEIKTVVTTTPDIINNYEM